VFFYFIISKCEDLSSPLFEFLAPSRPQSKKLDQRQAEESAKIIKKESNISLKKGLDERKNLIVI